MHSQSRDALDVISRYVGDYDVPFKYDHALSELFRMGTFEEPAKSDSSSLLAYIGACYCIMIREDVLYRIPEGLQWARRSEAAATRIKKAIAESPSSFGRVGGCKYILARWEDAYGRLLYRAGAYTLARLHFIEARHLSNARMACRYDILSNLHRTEFEIARQIGAEDEKQRSCCISLLSCACGATAAYRKHSTAIDRGKHPTSISAELNRAIISCLHNAFECKPAAGLSLSNSIRSKLNSLTELGVAVSGVLADFSDADSPGENVLAAIRSLAERHNDKYRDAQVVNLLRRRVTGDLRLTYTKELADSEWPRGRMFARQGFADLEAGEKGVIALLDICNSATKEQLGSDVDYFSWTLRMAEVKSDSLATSDRQRHSSSLTEARLAITEAVSSTVAVASYRTQFENQIRPRIRATIFDRLAKHRLSDRDMSQGRNRRRGAGQRLDELVDWLETFAAKEVLEVMRGARRESMSMQPDRLPAYLISCTAPASQRSQFQGSLSPKVPSVRTKSSAALSNVKGGVNQRVISSVSTADVSLASGDEQYAIANAAVAARRHEEEYWVGNPISIREATASAGQLTRRHTVAETGSLIIRFVIGTSTGRKQESTLNAIWWCGGKSGLVQLNDTSARFTAQNQSPIAFAESWRREALDSPSLFFTTINGNSTRIPKKLLAESLWSLFVAPVVMSAYNALKVKMTRITFVMDSGLYHLPLNLAWVPKKCDALNLVDRPLAMSVGVSFSLNLSAHIVEGRRLLNACWRDPEDEFVTIFHDTKNGAFFRPLVNELNSPRGWSAAAFDDAALSWDKGSGALNRGAVKAVRRAKVLKSATPSSIANTLARRAEFLTFACHGIDYGEGVSLQLGTCHLVNFNISHSLALRGNKLLVLGACDSATPKMDSYGQFIGAFVAAGSGAILASPCKAYIPTICQIGAKIVEQCGKAKGFVDLSDQLRKQASAMAKAYESGKFATFPDWCKLAASTYQLWL